ncbi:MAG: hypothetical protein QOH33_1203, partial [Paraburkholderia sp.]|nr:hypothetical protein [Paraburkholderia sp.]
MMSRTSAVGATRVPDTAHAAPADVQRPAARPPDRLAPQLGGLTALSRASASASAPSRARGLHPQANGKAGAEPSSPVSRRRKQATTLFGLRIAEIKRSMAEYARQPDEYGRIVQHEQRIVGPLRKVKDAMQLLGQPLENESSAAERTQQIDKRNALQTFNDDVTPFAASFSGLEKGVGGLVELHRLLAPLVRITGATASLGSRPPPQSLAKLDEHLDRAIASFGDVFDAASRGLPEWLAHGSSVGANLEANWKETIGAAIRLLLPDLLKVQNTVVLAHELIARAAIGKISTELVATRRAINEALNSSSNTGSTNSVELGPHAVDLRNNLSDFLSAANLYRDFSCRLDDTLARTN